jgi:hypothetical protein
MKTKQNQTNNNAKELTYTSLRGLNVQHLLLITPPNLHIACPLTIQNKK